MSKGSARGLVVVTLGIWAWACVGDTTTPVDGGSDVTIDDDAAAEASAEASADAGDAGACGNCDAGCFEGVCGGHVVVDLSVGSYTSCVAYASGSVWCWGGGDDGLLGVDPSTLTTCQDEGGGTHPCHPTPIKLAIAQGATHVAVAHYFACAILASGTVACWGRNGDWQLGHTKGQSGDTTCGSDTCQWAQASTVPGITGAKAILAGEYTACAIDGTNQLWCWGYGEFDENGHAGQTDALPAVILPSVTQASISDNAPHVCAVVSGDVKCWGMNYADELGHAMGTSGDTTCNSFGAYACNPTPVAVGLAGILETRSPQAYTCARSDAGVKCWGDVGGSDGFLGNGAVGGALAPVDVVSLLTPTAITGSQNFVCALNLDKTVSCWGHDDRGQLGIGTAGMQPDAGAASCSPAPCYPTPMKIPSFTASSVSCGNGTCLAIALDGTVWGWGENSLGQAGHLEGTSGDSACGTSLCAPKPTAVQGLP